MVRKAEAADESHRAEGVEGGRVGGLRADFIVAHGVVGGEKGKGPA